MPALNGSILEWLHIVREVQHDTLVCVYDRAGIGWSDPPPSGRLSIAAMAADLYALLGTAGVPPPYIVAGHSLGGVVARRITVAEMLLAARHRNQPADLGSLPLTVLTSASMPLDVWPQLQEELADLSTASRHIYAQRAGHNIHLDEPEAVIRALREMIRQCRS